MPRFDIKTAVQEMLQSSSVSTLPKGFRSVKGIEFAREVIRQSSRGNRTRSSKPSRKISIAPRAGSDEAQTILKKIDEARVELTGKEFDQLWSAFDLTLDISVLGGDVWAPRLLPNGAVLIRNHHRVIGIREQTYGYVKAPSAKLRSELAKLLATMAPSEDNDQKHTGFSLIHHDADGFRWTREIPAHLSDVGQTLVFLPAHWIGAAKRYPILGNPLIATASKEARSGHAVLRVFRDGFFLHTTERMSDEYDTILEEYSLALGESVDAETEPLTYSFDRGVVQELETRLFEERSEIDTTSLSPTLAALVRTGICSDFAKRKAAQVLEFQPTFASQWNEPATANGEPLYFHSHALKRRGNLVAFEIPLATLESLNAIETRLYTTIRRLFRGENVNKGWLYLPGIHQRGWYFEGDVFSFGSKGASVRLKEIQEELHEQYHAKHPRADRRSPRAERSFVSTLSSCVGVLIPTRGAPSPDAYHAKALATSTSAKCALRLHIPALGFNQTYARGKVTVGNSHLFVAGG